MKNGVIKKPLDEWLGLEKYVRFSPECLFQVAEVLTDLTYRKTSKHLELLKRIEVSKDTVKEVRKLATRLYKDRDDYREYQELETPKRQVKRLYIEGDGILVHREQGTEEAPERLDLAHFVILEGIEMVNGEKRLINKHRIIKASNLKARESVMNYLDKHYEITSDTLLITNSDMGRGYKPSVFREIQSFLGYQWEHFWDTYHLNQKIMLQFKSIPEVFTEDFNPEVLLFSAIRRHKKKEARLILDTVSSRIEDDEKQEAFEHFRQRFLQYFQYTKPAHLRGFTHEGIGLMESQNAMIAHRMKGYKMSWSVEGAETVAQMIIDVSEGTLRELFHGDWRKEWQRLQEGFSVSKYLKRVRNSSDGVQQVRQRQKYGKRLY